MLHVDADLMEESMQMIGGLQLLAHIQSSRYVIMRQVEYAVMLSECLLLGFSLMMDITFVFADFLGESNGSC